MSSNRPEVPFSAEDAYNAASEWGFNCGPAVVCAVLNVPIGAMENYCEATRWPGYTNPTIMKQMIANAQPKKMVQHFKHTAPTAPDFYTIPDLGIARIQWGGPWCRPGVPIGARYHRTHWIGCRAVGNEAEIFDISAIEQGGWLNLREWRDEVVPMITNTIPKASGEWWPTHIWSIER